MKFRVVMHRYLEDGSDNIQTFYTLQYRYFFLWNTVKKRLSPPSRKPIPNVFQTIAEAKAYASVFLANREKMKSVGKCTLNPFTVRIMNND